MTHTFYLFLTTGNGPTECRIALNHLIEKIEINAIKRAIECKVTYSNVIDAYGPSSAILELNGQELESFAADYIGTIRFTFKSPVRPNHKRKNWFVGVSVIDENPEILPKAINLSEIRFETMRAGGPGGQHQNTTDSAVRATHIPTGLTAVSREERSQHQNKASAIRKLESMLGLLQDQSQHDRKRDLSKRNKKLERGNEIRRF